MRIACLILAVGLAAAGCATQQGSAGYRLEAVGNNQLRISGIRFEPEDPIFAAAMHVYETCGGKDVNGLTHISFTSSLLLPNWTEHGGWRFTDMKCSDTTDVPASAEVLAETDNGPMRTMTIGLP